MNKLFQLISDGDGAPSTMRVAVLLIIVPIMTVWTVLSIRSGQMIDLDVKWLGLIGAALAAKTGQSFSEALTPPSPKPGVPGSVSSGAGVAVGLILFLCIGLFATGCKTVPAGQPSGVLSQDTNGIVYVGSWEVRTNDVYNAIKIGATIGTQKAVKADPHAVAYFQIVDAVLTVALNEKQYDPAIIQEAISNISIDEIQNKTEVANGINLGLIMYQAFFGQVVSQKIGDASPYLAPALAAFRDGIAAGLPTVIIN